MLLSATSVNNIVNGINNKIKTDTKLNYLPLREGTALITKIVSLVVGLLTTIILILVPIIVGLEVMYICFPALRAKTDELIMKIETKGYKYNFMQFTLRDAIKAVEEASIPNGENTSALVCYFKIKCTSVMFLSLIIAIILRGSSFLVGTVDTLVGNVITSLFG
jgi:hypothetical protein